MSRLNAFWIHVVFFLGVALCLFGLGTLLSPINIPYDAGESADSHGCGLTGQILVGLTFEDSGSNDVIAEVEGSCQGEAHARGLIALGPLLVGAGLIYTATKWARRIHRDDYVSPVVELSTEAQSQRYGRLTVRMIVGLAAVAVGLVLVIQGLVVVYAASGSSFAKCQQELPVPMRATTEETGGTPGYWPLGIECDWTIEGADVRLPAADWTATIVSYGGLAVAVAGGIVSFTASGARERIREGKHNVSV
ncbi:hypothetical protein [Glaciihabitans sp. dw_435]|uniref:hypothetical protein n=1 Tax=Glaciihabitans sp. dw_435 TaxID=2720081 RepID=UPI001BD2474F|nr:hypothetical protein [Glaciihabitans sp. dw_435]